MKELNRDIKTRDEVLFGKYNPDRYHFGGIARFEGLDVETLKWLLEHNFADPDETQNDSPTIEEFLDFMERHPEFTAHGYAVTDKRDDYRISIEGVETNETPADRETIFDFMGWFRFADELQLDPPYCWYD